MWLIGWRVLQALGGSMLTANSAAILTDAFPADQRGLALGTNQIAAIAGQFVGLIAGGLLAAIDWRAVFWVNVPVGVFGTVWAYHKLRETAERHPASIDWWGNVTFAVGLGAVLIAITYGIQPYGGHTMGWTNPWVLRRPDRRSPPAGGLRGHRAPGGRADVPARPVPDPRLRGGERRRVHRRRSPAAACSSCSSSGCRASGCRCTATTTSTRRCGRASTCSRSRIAFLASGPISGYLSDRFGSRGFATAGMLVFGASFVGLLTAARRLLLLGVRAAHPPQRHRRGHVRRAQLLLDHGQRPAGHSAAPPRGCAPPSRTRARRSRSASSSR